MLTAEHKAFGSALCDLAVKGASYIPGEPLEITEFIMAELAKKFAEQTGKATINDFIDSAEQVIITGGKAFGSEKAQSLCNNLAEAIDAGQDGRYFEVFTEGMQVIQDAKKVHRENKAKKAD